MKARSALAVLAVAVALALAAGPGHGFVDDDDSSTIGEQTGQPAPAGLGPVPETTSLQPEPGIKPSKTAPEGSTREEQAPANQNADLGEPITVVDTSDTGVKNLPVTEDLGTKDLPAGQDLGDR